MTRSMSGPILSIRNETNQLRPTLHPRPATRARNYPDCVDGSGVKPNRRFRLRNLTEAQRDRWWLRRRDTRGIPLEGSRNRVPDRARAVLFDPAAPTGNLSG